MNALVRSESASLVTFNEIERMAAVMAESKLFGIQTAAQYMTLMFLAQAEGQHPATVAQDYDIIQGKPARKTHSVLARYQAAGGTVKWGKFTETVVSGTFSHPKGGSLEIEWTIEMAQRADLAGKDNWKKRPRAMLRARCIAEGVRATYPAALGGQMIVEEAIDLVNGGEPYVDASTGELKQGGAPATPPAPPAPQTWPQDAFDKQFPRWSRAIAEGLKSHDDIVTLARSKAPLTSEQEVAIRTVPINPPPSNEPGFGDITDEQGNPV